MASKAKRDDPELWEKVKADVTAGDKGGRPDQWSARKAQLAVQEYQKRGGGYEGQKSKDNSLKQWTEEEWGTGSGKESGKTGERYLPKAARENLSQEEYERTTAKKRSDTKKGKQFSSQPDDVARKTAPHRKSGGGNEGGEPTRTELMDAATRQNIRGRSRMNKTELQKALGG